MLGGAETYDDLMLLPFHSANCLDTQTLSPLENPRTLEPRLAKPSTSPLARHN
jgi:hypothetical protein